MNKNTIILAGGSGFCGQLLTERFAARGWNVIVFTRAAPGSSGAAREVHWNGRDPGNWVRELEGADAVVNLSGRSVNCRYNAGNRRKILESRVFSTQALGQAIGSCRQPPRVWLNASTATIYKHSYDKIMDEAGEIAGTRDAKDEFSVEVAQAWEKAFDEAKTPGTRHVTMRMAMVFSAKPGTVFRVLRRLVKLGLGGSMGGGRQFVAWMHEEDYCRAVEWLIDHDDFSGRVNMVSPNPLPNREMMRTLRRVCGMPLGLPAARWMLEIGAFVMRTETELIIKSRRAVPGRLVSAGFEFRFPRFEEAARDLEKKLGVLPK